MELQKQGKGKKKKEELILDNVKVRTTEEVRRTHGEGRDPCSDDAW